MIDEKTRLYDDTTAVEYARILSYTLERDKEKLLRMRAMESVDSAGWHAYGAQIHTISCVIEGIRWDVARMENDEVFDRKSGLPKWS